MSLQENIEQRKQSELIGAGFQPQRYGFIVKFVRRLIWPIVRPFHFFQLSEISNISYHLGLLEQKTDVLEQKTNVLEQKHDVLEQKTNEISKLVKEQVLLRSELAALKNRFLALDSLDDRVAKISCRLSRELLVTNSVNGIFIGKPGEIISDLILNGEVWDSHIIELAHEVISGRKEGGAIDIGAHLGSTTIALAPLFVEVFSFEPNDFNFRLLRANVVINNLENVHLFNCGLYSHPTSLFLSAQANQEVPLSLNEQGDFDGHLASNLGAYSFSEAGSGFFEHSARTLDSYEFNNISFIKIDVQGADGEVLMGALQTIRRCRPVIVFEWEEILSRNFSVTLDSIMHELSNLSYEISPLKVHNEKQIDYVARPVVIKTDLE